MTPTPASSTAREELLVQPFPEPGPALRTAYRELALAAHGTDEQKKALGDPTGLPRPWIPATCRTKVLREQLWDWLDRFVTWLNHEYVWDPAGVVPPCWPNHPHLVHEIAVLADQRQRANRALDSDVLEEWHRYSLPPFIERVRNRVQDHCTDGHQPWPARSRYAAHNGVNHSKVRTLIFTIDTSGMQKLLDTEHAPPSTGAHLHAIQVDPQTGEILD